MAEPAVPAVSARDIADRVGELGDQIATDYRAGSDLVVIGVLKGCLPFVADLVRRIDLELEVDFMALTSYGSGARVRLTSDTAIPLEGRHVLVVDCLVDTGFTLASVLRLLEPRSCASVRTAVLFDKAPRRIADVTLDYRGYAVGDEFLVGYGLGHGGWFRNLPDVWAVTDMQLLAQPPSRMAAALFTDMGDSLMGS
jgi:hypoxanthine phosphoribosyltransferase